MAELLVGLQAKATQYWDENQEGIKAKGKGAFMKAVARLQKHGHEKAVAAAALKQFQRSDPVQEGWTDDGGKIDVSRIPNVLFLEAFLTPCEAPLVASRHAQVTYCGILEKKHTELPFMPAKYVTAPLLLLQHCCCYCCCSYLCHRMFLSAPPADSLLLPSPSPGTTRATLPCQSSASISTTTGR